MNCLIPNTHRRLNEAHRLWHQTMDNYFDPEGFRTNLNATIQALRNLTFALQAEKKNFDEFDNWYASWRGKMKKDKLMKWLNKARVTIVHKGDLKTNSIARVSIYHYNEIFKADISIPINLPYEMIAKYLKEKGFITELHIRENYILKIKRKWIIDTLDYELLNALAYCYGFLHELVNEAHNIIDCQIDKCDINDNIHEEDVIIPKSKVPSCMSIADKFRTTRVALKDLVELRVKEDIIKNNEETITKANRRYNLESEKTVDINGDIFSITEHIIKIAKKILKVDKHHAPMVFLLSEDKNIFPITAPLPYDRADLFIIMEKVAEKVEELNASGVVLIFESWKTDDLGILQDRVLVSDSKRKKECLIINAITKNKVNKTYIIPFIRNDKGDINFKEAIINEGKNENLFYLKPIYDVWNNKK